MTNLKVFLATIFAIALSSLACPLMAADSAGAKEQAVNALRIGEADYQNFLNNWDETKQPVLYALIQKPAQYKALFSPAPVMGEKRAFAPDASFYAKEQIVLVARVMAAPDNMASSFAVERITEKGQELAVHYRFNEAKTNASYTVKNYLALRIPAREYTKVTFFENGKQVGILQTDKGQWSVPAMK